MSNCHDAMSRQPGFAEKDSDRASEWKEKWAEKIRKTDGSNMKQLGNDLEQN